MFTESPKISLEQPGIWGICVCGADFSEGRTDFLGELIRVKLSVHDKDDSEERRAVVSGEGS